MTALQAEAFVAPEPTDPSELLPSSRGWRWRRRARRSSADGRWRSCRARCRSIGRCGRRSRRSVTSGSCIRE